MDGETWQSYGQNLEGNLKDLHERLHRGAYRARPSRRVFIPKAGGRLRPLGIAALEDKILQRAVVEVLNAIYYDARQICPCWQHQRAYCPARWHLRGGRLATGVPIAIEVIVDLIGSTTASTGLKVHAEHDTGSYPKGIEVSDEGLAAVSLKPHEFHGEWNYTVAPK